MQQKYVNQLQYVTLNLIRNAGFRTGISVRVFKVLDSA